MSPMMNHFYTLLFLALVVVITVAFTLFLRKLFLTSTLLQAKPGFFPRAAVITVVLSMIIAVTGFIATVRMVDQEEQRIKRQASLSVTMARTVIEGSINRINAGVATIAGSPWVRPVLENPTTEHLDNAHSVLDRYLATFDAAVVYLLDTSGVTIASSNRRAPDSFIGNNYSFRPYFTRALGGHPSSYFAVGVTSGKRGYYRSAPVIDSVSGAVLGVAVIKNSLEALDSVFASLPDAFFIDRHNMIFLASDTLLQGRLFCAGTDMVDIREELKVQYGAYSLEPVLPTCAKSGNYVRYNGGNYLFSTAAIPVQGWSLVVLSPLVSLQRYYLLGLSVTTLFLLVVLVIFSLSVLYQVKLWAESVFLSEKRFRTVFESAPEAIVIAEMETGIIVAANPLARHLVKEGVGRVTINGILGENEVSGRISLPLSAGAVRGVYRVADDTSVRSISVSSATLQFKGNVCLVSFWRDITGLMETRNALAASERQYRELTELLPEGVFEIDMDRNFTYANRRTLDMIGYAAEEVVGKMSPVAIVVPEEESRVVSDIEKVIREKSQGHFEYTARHRNGSTFPVLVHNTVMSRDNRVTGICGIVIDLTERKRIEAELQKKEKLEALGILAGGIAHDFNNLLTALWSGFSLIRIAMKNNPEISRVADEMEHAIQRGKDLTGQLLTYSKGGVPIKSTMSLEELVRETSGFITTGTPVQCSITAERDLFPVDVDATQISQVVQNLLINAIEAMPEGGAVTIHLRNTTVSDGGAGEIPSGRYVEMVVSDEGGGIPEEIRSRIFDPFYTTKPNGSGLGLATTYSIVKKHNGYISVKSIVGKGTSFVVLVPASERHIASPEEKKTLLRKGKGRVLVMDDEPTILTVTEKLLSMTGYEVITAKDGIEAVRVYEEAMRKKNPADVVILDLTVPAGLGGKETVKRILAIDPAAKVIVSSGYSNDPIMANYAKFGFKAVIAKPYNVQQLHGVIQSLLAREKE